MAQEQTCYQLFGIDQQATPSQIRRAYLRLVKKYHPDADDNDSSGLTAALIRQINRSYEILKDPQKRAAYDASLRARQTRLPALRPSPAVRSRRTYYTVEQRRSVLIMVSSLTMMLLFSYVAGSLISFSTQATAHQNRATASILSAALPSRDEILGQTKLATSMSGNRAVEFSRRCFDNAKTIESGTAIELCIIFDDAQLYWGRSPFQQFPTYFQDPVATIRHTDELGPYEDHVDAKLLQLRSMVFNILLNQVSETGEQADAPSTKLPQPADAQSGKPSSSSQP